LIQIKPLLSGSRRARSLDPGQGGSRPQVPE
jgi:hypothetical protein